MKKIILFILLSFINLMQPEQNSQLQQLLPVVKNSGWNKDLLEKYSFLLYNSEYNIQNEFNRLKELNPSSERTYLFSILLKRNGKFREMYDSLYSGLAKKPRFLEYYDELNFAVSATGQTSIIDAFLEKNTLSEPYKSYLAGVLKSSSNNHGEAIKNLEHALISSGNNQNILFELSNEYRSIGNYKYSLILLNKLEKFLDKEDKLNVPVMIAKGSIYFLSGEYEKAAQLYNLATALSKKNNDKINYSKSLVDKGIIADLSGKVDDARSYFLESINIATKISFYEGIAFASSELGVSYSFSNDLIRAKKYYTGSYEVYKKIGNRLRLALLSDNLGKLYMAMFDYPSAMKYYEDGLQLAGENKRAQVLNLMGLADIYSNLANYSRAIEYYKKAEKISSEIKDIDLKSEVNGGIGVINYNLKNFNNALTYFTASEEIAAKENNLILQADFIHKAGLCYFEIDSLAKSEKFLMKALELSRGIKDRLLEANALKDLSLVYFKYKDIGRALNLLKESRSIASQNNLNLVKAEIDMILGDKSQSFEGAKTFYSEALDLSVKLNNFQLRTEALASIARLFEKNHLTEAARSYYESAINLIEDVSRPLFSSDEIQIKYISSQKDVYDSYAHFLISQGDFEYAFLMLDRSKSRNMIQNITNLKLQTLIKDKSFLSKLYEYEWMIHSELYRNVDSVKALYASLKKDLIKADPKIERYLIKRNYQSIGEYQRLLKDNENVLSIFSDDYSSELFLLNKNQLFHNSVPYGKKFITMTLNEISPYYNLDPTYKTTYYNQDLFAFNSNSAYKLYNTLLKDILVNVPKGSKLIIIPSSELFSFPFEILVSEQNKQQSPYNYKDKKFLLYDYDISYSPSLSSLLQQTETSNNKKSLIVGDPTINITLETFSERRGLLEDNPSLQRNISLLPLKYSHEEVDHISDILNAENVLTGKNATETNFKKMAEQNNIIHLSTHSFLINAQPVIFFSNFYDPENDGFLEASEIAKMNLNNDLVVLSSCSSGLGQVDKSEGVLGMTKAFFEAGTRSIVVSLWEVNDNYTSKLMGMFYEQLNKGKDKGEALRDAKIEFIKKYSPNPYYWGAFIISGNNGKVNIKHVSVFHWYWYILILTVIISIIYYLRRKRI